jgi:hypothetical protein
MNSEVTLTAEEFKRVHNAISSLASVSSQLADFLKPELSAKLVNVQNELQMALASAYDQDDHNFELKTEHYDAVKQHLGIENSEWSIYTVHDLYERHAFKAAEWVVYGDHDGPSSVRAAIKGSTWADLWLAADQCIDLSKDQHHVYIERFDPAPKDLPGILFLRTGS